MPRATWEESLLPACLEQPLGAVHGMMSPGVGSLIFYVRLCLPKGVSVNTLFSLCSIDWRPSVNPG